MVVGKWDTSNQVHGRGLQPLFTVPGREQRKQAGNRGVDTSWLALLTSFHLPSLMSQVFHSLSKQHQEDCFELERQLS